MMRKLLSLFLVFALLTACDENDGGIDFQVPFEQPACLLVEEHYYDELFVPQINTFQYDAEGHAIHAQQLLDDNGDGRYLVYADYTKITKDKKGNVIATEAYYHTGELVERNLYVYSKNNLLIKWTRFVPYDGKMRISYSYTYEYASPTQLKKVTRHHIPNIPEYHLFEYKDGLMTKVFVYENGQHAYTKVLQYDDKNTPMNQRNFLIMGANGANFELIGFPFQHNIIKETHINLRTNSEYVLYTTTYAYNAAGFPTTMHKNFGAGRDANATYAYQCK